MSPTPTQETSAKAVRQQFIDFFRERAGHRFVPSSPVVPHDDPTLLFTNAGMNQFKPVFLGQVAPGSPYEGLRRAVNSQKCIRAGGKHNDLDDVGKDTYHHTFFEMLGNWSFGDYFKAEAIQWAWELLTDIWGLDPERLYATYFEGSRALSLDPDREAYDLWCKYLPPERVLPGDAKDNFWEMGDTGPCGPCSELHYDGRSDEERARVPGHQLVNRESPDVIEVWNLVFIQFNRLGQTTLEPLPEQHVDTGMGFERIVRVLQGKSSNYDTDVFAPLFEAIREVCGARAYGGSLTDPVDVAYRVLADHARCLTVAITDGAEPSNEGRGYVLRRILRRAVRYGRQTLGVPGPFLHRLVPTVVESMGEAFPELREARGRVEAIIQDEEEAFGRTLDHGIRLFEQAAESAEARSGAGHLRITGEEAFKLHDTYGFPVDLTQLMAEERGLTVATEEFERLMEEARERSRAESGGPDESLLLPGKAVSTLRGLGVKPTDDLPKFDVRPQRGMVEAIWNGTDFDEDLKAANTRPTDRFAVVLDRTTFYAEMGGQVADVGRLVSRKGGGEFEVEDVRNCGGFIVHIGRVRKGEIRVGQEVDLRIDQPRRKRIAAHHTATHLLNLALRETLGEGADQKGSLVAPDRARFDFAHNAALTPEEAARVEGVVRGQIEADLKVYSQEVPLEKGRAINGLRAVFGETYPDPVRVVSIGPSVEELLEDPSNESWRGRSIEFCGGTHLQRTSEAGAFAITAEESVAKGVRRVIAVCGEAAERAVERGKRLRSRARGAGELDPRHLGEEVRAIEKELELEPIPLTDRAALQRELHGLRGTLKQAQKQAAGAERERAVEAARALAEGGSDLVIAGVVPGGSDRGAVLAAMDAVRAKRPEAAVLLVSPDQEAGKVTIVAQVPEGAVAAGLKAGDWVREASSVVGGKGGGRPDTAQGGGTQPEKADDAVARAIEFAGERLGSG